MVQCCPIKLFINVDIKCIYLGDRLTCKLRGTRQVFGKSHSGDEALGGVSSWVGGLGCKDRMGG